MKISVALATYNGASYIERQLFSIKNQTYPPSEVVISDDCSTDNTYEIVKAFIQNYNLSEWRLRRNTVNVGYIQNFQSALSLCSGELIFTCDQDDIWDVQKLESIIQIYRDNPSAQVICSSICFIDLKGRPLKKEFIPYGMHVKKSKILEIPLWKILEKNFFPGCAMAFSSAIAKEYLRSKNTELEHDWAIAVLGGIYHSLYWYNRELVSYRIHEKNTVGLHRITDNIFKYAVATIRKWDEYLEHLEDRLSFVWKRQELLTQEQKRHCSFLMRRCKYVKARDLKTFLRTLFYYRDILKKYDVRAFALDILMICFSPDKKDE